MMPAMNPHHPTHHDAECERIARQIGNGFRYASLPLRGHDLYAVTAIRALDKSLEDIVQTIAEPQVARTKLDWWRGALHQATTETHSDHPILLSLLESTTPTTLERMVPHLESRLGSALIALDYQGFAAETDLNAYLDAKGGALFTLYAQALDLPPETTAQLAPLGALSHRIDSLQWLGRDVARGFVYLPAEQLEKHGRNEADFHRPDRSARLAPLLQAEYEHIRAEHNRHVLALKQVCRRPPAFFRALIALDQARLDHLHRSGLRLLDERPERAPFSQLFTAWWATKRALAPLR
jgi:15-cis-phytoene synthase